MTVFALATFGCTIPHFIYGNDLLHSAHTFYGGGSSNAQTAISTSIPMQNSSVIDAYISEIHPASYSNLCQNVNANHTDSNGRYTQVNGIDPTIHQNVNQQIHQHTHLIELLNNVSLQFVRKKHCWSRRYTLKFEM